MHHFFKLNLFKVPFVKFKKGVGFLTKSSSLPLLFLLRSSPASKAPPCR